MKPILSGLLVVLLVVSPGCASGIIDTSTGPRQAAEVQTQDTVADLLHEFSEAHRQAVVAHDARAGQEAPEAHAAARETLKATASGLRASWGALGTWKASTTSGTAPADILRPLLGAASDFLALAVRSKALTQERADQILAFLRAAFPGVARGRPVPVRAVLPEVLA